MVGPTHCQESFNTDWNNLKLFTSTSYTCHDQVDAGAEADSVGGVVEVGEEGVWKEVVVHPVEVHPQHLHDSEHNVQAVGDV